MAELNSPAQWLWNGFFAMVWLTALVVLWRRPRSWFAGDLRGKALWALGVAALGVGFRGYWLPIGAIVFLVRRRRASYASTT